MSGNNTDDKYRKLAYDPATGGRKREWIRYGDGVYEPVRKDENPRDKWSDPHRQMTWWLEEKPEPWRPSDDGAGMSLNHDYGEENKPGWVIAELDLARLADVRTSGQVFNHRDWDSQFRFD